MQVTVVIVGGPDAGMYVYDTDELGYLHRMIGSLYYYVLISITGDTWVYQYTGRDS